MDSRYVEEMIRAIEVSDRIFSVSSKMIQMYHPDLIDSAGDLYTLMGWGVCRGAGRPVSNYTEDDTVFTACAGAAIYRRSVFDKIGFFDESHFAYLEDIDVGYRAMIYGYKNRFCASETIRPQQCLAELQKYAAFAADPEFHPITFGISGEIFIFLQNRIWNRLQKRNQRRNPWSVQMPQGSVSDGASRQLYPDRICPDTPHIRLCGRLAEKKIIA